MSMGMLSETDKDHPRHYLRDQGFDAYTPEDHATWATLARRQRAVLQGRICDSFLQGLDALGISDEGSRIFA